MQKRLFLTLFSALIMLTVIGGAFAHPMMAQAGGGSEDICVKDGATTTTVMSSQSVRETFRANHARLRGIGSTVSMSGVSGNHTHVIIWVVLYYSANTDEYTVRVINVVTGCNG